MARRSISRRACVRGSLVGAIVVAAGGAPVWAQSGDVIQSQDTNWSGVVGEITQVKRKDGVLTLKMRLRNNGSKKPGDWLTGGYNTYDNFYLTAGDKKYFVLRDTEGKPLATDDGDGYVGAEIAKDETFTWWAKFPAPPADVTSVTFYTPIAPPFEDLPITD